MSLTSSLINILGIDCSSQLQTDMYKTVSRGNMFCVSVCTWTYLYFCSLEGLECAGGFYFGFHLRLLYWGIFHNRGYRRCHGRRWLLSFLCLLTITIHQVISIQKVHLIKQCQRAGCNVPSVAHFLPCASFAWCNVHSTTPIVDH